MTSRTLFALTLAATLLCAIAQPTAAQPKPAVLVPAGSEIGFTTKQMGVPVDGKFSAFNAQIVLEFPDNASLQAGYASPDYKPLLAMRLRATTGRVIAADGV